MAGGCGYDLLQLNILSNRQNIISSSTHIIESFRGTYKRKVKRIKPNKNSDIINNSLGKKKQNLETECSFNKLLLKKHKKICMRNKNCNACEKRYHNDLSKFTKHCKSLIFDIGNIVVSYIK